MCLLLTFSHSFLSSPAVLATGVLAHVISLKITLQNGKVVVNTGLPRARQLCWEASAPFKAGTSADWRLPHCGAGWHPYCSVNEANVQTGGEEIAAGKAGAGGHKEF